MSQSTTTQGADTVSRVVRGQTFPNWDAPLVGGGEITIPEDLADGWAGVLFYRGHWCPYCRQQLTDFQAHLDAFREQNISVVALSADPEDQAELTVERHGLEFPVAYGIEPLRARDTLGSYLGPDEGFVQATGFVLGPGGQVRLAVYSSGAVGRLVAEDVLGFIEYERSQE